MLQTKKKLAIHGKDYSLKTKAIDGKVNHRPMLWFSPLDRFEIRDQTDDRH